VDRCHTGNAIWAAARSLIGTRFRLHGRDPAIGLDCVGLVAAALTQAGRNPGPLPSGYGLSDHHPDQIIALLKGAGLIRCDTHPIGSIALYSVGRGQHHLAVLGPASAVHAHASLRRVVESPLPLEGEIVGCFALIQYPLPLRERVMS
jgi:hypothetical protein